MVKAEEFEEEGVFVFDKEKAEGVKVNDWARWVAWNLLNRDKGEKNATFLARTILNQERKPVFTESGWKKQLSKINSSSYQSPFPEIQEKGSFSLTFLCLGASKKKKKKKKKKKSLIRSSSKC